MAYPPGMMGKRFVHVGVGEALSGAFDRYMKNFGAFFLFWAVPALIGFVLTIGQYYLQFSMIKGADMYAGQGISTGFSILSAIISILFTGGLVGMTYESMRSGTTSIGTGFNTISTKAGSILVTYIVVGLLIAIGLMCCIVPGIIFCYWWVFALAAAVIEGTDLSMSMNNSKEFSKAHDSLVFIIALVVVVFLVQIIFGIISAVAMFMMIATLGIWGAIMVIAVVSLISGWILQPYAMIAITYYYVRGNGYA